MTEQVKSNAKEPKPAQQQAEQKPIEEKKEVEQVKQVDWKEKYLRLYAEFENYKKRTAKQQLAWVYMANERLIMALLPIVEDFDRALASKQNETNHPQIAKQGIQIIHEKLSKTLLQQGLSPMEVAQGDSFDPDYHEALATVAVKDEKLKGKIVEVVSKGYLLNKKVIQVAKVIIGA